VSVLTLLLRRPTLEPLPGHPAIAVQDIPPASALLFYGGPRITELVGERVYKHPYHPPAFHAAFYIAKGLFLNVGAFREIADILGEFRTTRRIDVLIYTKLDPVQRETLGRRAMLDTSRPRGFVAISDYSWRDFLRFGLTFLRPSKKEFCSENVVDLFQSEKIITTDLPADRTAPWDLYEYALAHPDEVTIRTLWIGPEFVTKTA
jgi:hypothetical protein